MPRTSYHRYHCHLVRPSNFPRVFHFEMSHKHCLAGTLILRFSDMCLKHFPSFPLSPPIPRVISLSNQFFIQNSMDH